MYLPRNLYVWGAWEWVGSVLHNIITWKNRDQIKKYIDQFNSITDEKLSNYIILETDKHSTFERTIIIVRLHVRVCV